MNTLKKFMEHFADYGRSPDGMGKVGCQIATVIFAGFMELSMFFPVSLIIRGNEGSMYVPFAVEVFAATAVLFQMNHCVVQKEEGKNVTIYQKLAYVPVARKTIQKILWRRLLRYIGITTAVAVVQQVGVTLVLCPQDVWQNLWYAVSTAAVLPLVMGLIQICRK